MLTGWRNPACYRYWVAAGRAALGYSWALLGAFWAQLGWSWGVIGVLLGRSEASWDGFWNPSALTRKRALSSLLLAHGFKQESSDSAVWKNFNNAIAPILQVPHNGVDLVVHSMAHETYDPLVRKLFSVVRPMILWSETTMELGLRRGRQSTISASRQDRGGQCWWPTGSEHGLSPASKQSVTAARVLHELSLHRSNWSHVTYYPFMWSRLFPLFLFTKKWQTHASITNNYLTILSIFLCTIHL